MKLIKTKRKQQVTYNKTNFYQSAAWKKLRKFKLINDPNCEECLKEGKTVKADMVDHDKQISMGADPNEYENLRSLCNHHHAVKRAQESNRSQKEFDPYDDLAK